ncbi:hypothetical protein ACYUJ6_02940 [Clostridium sp. JNZ X4-2]
MLKRNIKVITALLTVLTSLNISSFMTVHASSAEDISVVSQAPLGKNNNNKHHDYKSRLDNLVKDGVITQKQENAALDLIKSDDFREFMKKNHKCSKNKLNRLVENGTITKEQESSIRKVFSSSRSQGKNFRSSLDNGLDDLVNKGTINKQQKASVQNLLISCRKEHIDNLTVFFKHKFDTLVSNGTITQKQEEAIIKSLTTFKHTS